MNGRSRTTWELVVALQLLCLGAWSVFASVPLAAAAAALALVGIGMSGRHGAAARMAVSVLGLAGAGAAWHTSWQVGRVENEWNRVEQQLIERAARQLEATLGDAVVLAEALAEQGVNESQGRAGDFVRLEGVLAGRSPERGVVVFDRDGMAWAWAGALRLATAPGRNGLRARITPFYVVLEAQRELDGRVAIGQVVLAADSAIPDRDRSVAARFERATGSVLQFFPADNAPAEPGIFDYCVDDCDGSDTEGVLFSVRAVPPAQGTLKLAHLERGGRRVAVAIVLSLAVLLVVGGVTLRWVSAVGTGVLFAVTPIGSRLGLDSIFLFGRYFLSPLRVVPISSGTLLVVGTLALVSIGTLWHRHGQYSTWWILPAAGVVGGVFALLSYLVTGITPPASGVTVGMWLVWVVGIALLVSAVLIFAAILLRRAGPVRSHPWMFWVSVLSAAFASILGVALWQPVGGFPDWYALVWLTPVLLAIQPDRGLRVVIAAAAVAGAASAVLTWGAVVQGRLVLAERDMRRFGQESDPFAQGYLERFGRDLQATSPPRSAAELYTTWRRSPLSDERYPAILVTWGPSEAEVARLDLAEMSIEPGLLRLLARQTGDGHDPMIEEIPNVPGVHYVLSVPYIDGSVVSVAVGPRTLALAPLRVAQSLRGELQSVAPYEMLLSDLQPVGTGAARLEWVREGDVISGERAFPVPGGVRHLHVRVPLISISNATIRGALLALLMIVLVALLWLAGEGMRGRLPVNNLRELVAPRSYRTRLLLVLGLFFFLPTLGFGAWSVRRLGVEVDRARDLLVRQTLKDAAGTAIDFAILGGETSRERLDALADQLDVELVLYEDGELVHSSAPVLAELGLIEGLLDPELYRQLVINDELEATADRNLGGRPTRVGYRSLGGGEGQRLVLAAPRLADDRGFGDFYALLLATLLGLAAAVWLANRAAGTLAKPVQALSAAASAVGRGETVASFESETPTEFIPVVNAFERMANDVRSHQLALEEALKFTGAVLSNVATGVLALDRHMHVTTANPRALALLGTDPGRGMTVAEATDPSWEPVWDWVRNFAAEGRDVDAEEFTLGERRIRAQVALLSTADRGWVVALDDATELATAERVLAWGEMARQIAHEIKNPLTPIRLGVQHLQRAYADPRGDFGKTLSTTGLQILEEIERLDGIAKAFSRFGSPMADAGPLELVDVVAIARETVSLYGMGSASDVELSADGPHMAIVRSDEFKEVLVNLVENARAANAAHVRMTVSSAGSAVEMRVVDDGDGIPAATLPRIFEPQFSTNTSGTGLGLAISRRLVESWGGQIRVESDVGKGTTMILSLESK